MQRPSLLSHVNPKKVAAHSMIELKEEKGTRGLACNGMGMDPFVVFPAGWAAAGFGIHATPTTLPFPSGYI